ncbi:MAG: hypothetical protein B6I24_02270 [Bacteroidetes bacterium 4572_128]|nr:MAG: hypothetical protein B6I24_02270 [Bacteroidetes bacterium 4572_128]
MKFKFTITKKLGIGFVILLIAVAINAYLIYITAEENRKTSIKITQVYMPSVSYLHDLSYIINNSKFLIKNWVLVDRKENTPEKKLLKSLHDIIYVNLEKKISNKFVFLWKEKDKKIFFKTKILIEKLFKKHKIIMSQLKDFESYEDPLVFFEINPQVETNGEIIEMTDEILKELNILIENQEKIVDNLNAQIIKDFSWFERLVVYMGNIMGIIVLLTGILTIRTIKTPLEFIKNIVLDMGKGILPKKEIKVSNDEIGEMSIALNILVKNLKKTSEFSEEIGKGNFKIKFTSLSENDLLGNSLIKMKNELYNASKEEALRKKENEERRWTTNGIAMFSDILQKNDDNINNFSFDIIKNLIKYVGVNQGGLFIINDENKNDIFLELMASYAYSRKKILEKRIEIGEGLLGRCMQEQEIIYITDLPKTYINIGSGLGDSKPRSLLIVPLKVNEKIYGVIEIASFLELKNYKIEFVEKIGENIASAIATLKTNLNTVRLLKDAKFKEEELALRDEEMRQNLEELQVTKESLAKREKEQQRAIKILNIENKKRIGEIMEKDLEMRGQLNAVDNTTAVVEFDMKGKIKRVNKLFEELIGYSDEEMVGNSYNLFISEEKEEIKFHKKLWDDLNEGEIYSGEFVNIDKFGKEIWLKSTYVPVLDKNKKPYKIIASSLDITSDKLTFLDLKGKINGIERSNAIIEMDINGKIIYINELFADLLEYPIKEIIGMNHDNIVNKEYVTTKFYADFWNKLKKGEFIKGAFKRIKKNGDAIWVSASYNPIFNIRNNIYKIIIFAHDITKQRRTFKNLEINNKKLLEQEDKFQQNIEEMKILNEKLKIQLSEKNDELKEKEKQISTSLEKMKSLYEQIEKNKEKN